MPRNTKTSPTTIEITTKKGEVGCAGIQFFSAKKSSVMISKQNRNELIMVKALAFKVIKPLLSGLITGELTEESIMKLEKKPFDKTIGKFKPSDCTQCGKTFVNSHGVSVHMAKVHERKCEGCQTIFQTTNELKLHGEVCHIKHIKTPISNEKQKRQATPESKGLTCEHCNFKANNESEVENHTIKEHPQTISPDPKRYKANHVAPVEETLQRLKSLSVEGEELMDVTEFEAQKKRKREIPVIATPNRSKKTVKESPVVIDIKENENVKTDPNLRDLPVEVKQIIGDDSKEYMVKGDGPCLLRTTAAHIEGDEDKGIELARDLNTHQALNREWYKEKLSSKDFPMTVTIGVKGEIKTFKNSDDYFDWLQESKEAAFMWRGCIDVMGICNMAQMNIDIVIHENGQKAQLRSFEPDINFPWKEEDPMKPLNPGKRKQDKMTVLNWKDVHYNLIVSKDHMLFQHGSFKFQENKSKVKENHLEKHEIKTSVVKDHDDCNKRLQEKDIEINQLKLKLEESKSKLNRMIDNQPNTTNASYDIRDVEELDSEAAFVRKEGFIRTSPQESSVPVLKCQQCNFVSKKNENLGAHMLIHSKTSTAFRCDICDKNLSTKTNLTSHMRTSHRSSPELNCDDCDFQAHSGRELNNHLNLKHHKKAKGGSEDFNCNICGENFIDYWNLMNHRRDIHPERRRRCRNNQKGECERSGEECWWKHADEGPTYNIGTHNKSVSCNICDELFTSKGLLMNHKKKEHIESVPVCRDFQKGRCDFPSNRCWYKHVSQEEHVRGLEDPQEKEASEPQGFWNLPETTKPPEGELLELKEIMKKAMEMILTVNQKLVVITN